jgi:hypothetical protein
MERRLVEAVKREDYFIIDEGGHRHYGATIDRLRRGQLARWVLAIASLGALVAANVWRRFVLGDNVLAYVAIYGCVAFFVWRLVHARAIIHEFERQWLYHQRDEAHSAAQANSAAATVGGQPTGYQTDEQAI